MQVTEGNFDRPEYDPVGEPAERITLLNTKNTKFILTFILLLSHTFHNVWGSHVTPSQLFCLIRDPVTRIRVFQFFVSSTRERSVFGNVAQRSSLGFARSML